MVNVFNDSLSFEFPPVEFPGLTNQLSINYFTSNAFRGYAVSHYTGSADTTVLKPRIMLYSLDGKRTRERLFSDLDLNGFIHMEVFKNKNTDGIYLLGIELLELNDQLSVIKKAKSPFNSYFYYYNIDIDYDGEDELVLYSADEEKLVIYNAALKKIAETKLKGIGEKFRFSHYSSKEHEKKIFFN